MNAPDSPRPGRSGVPAATGACPSRRDRRSHQTEYLLGVLLLMLVLPVVAFGAYPQWWIDRGVVISSTTTNDHAAVNQGQVKHLAAKAYDELQAKLPGGASSTLTTLIGSFTTTNVNYQPVTIGQLKNVAKPFYDRLIAVGYTNAYPWSATTSDDNDHALGNIGQAKYAFGWDLTIWLASDSDGDGLPNGVDADPLTYDHTPVSFIVTHPSDGTTIYP